MNEWIIDWSKIDSDKRYIVCPINETNTGEIYIGQSIGVMQGWAVKTMLPRCYAALLFPDFDGQKFKEDKVE